MTVAAATLTSLPLETLEALVDNVPIGVIVLDSDGLIRRFNRYEEQLSGKLRQQVLGRSFFDDVAPCTREIALEDRFREGVRSDTLDIDVDFQFPYPYNRVPRDVRIRARSFKTAEERSHVILVEDITAKRALERKNHELFERVRRLLQRYVGHNYTAELENAERGILPATDEQAFVLFADIAGFSSFAKDVAPAELFARLSATMGDAVSAVHRNGGIVDKLLGDGLLAWFRPSQSGERAVWNALMAAREIRRLQRPGLQFRVGVAFGDVTYGTLGTDAYGNVTLLGHAVNLARRLQEAAGVAEVFVDAAVVDAARGGMDVTPIVGVRLKGIDDAATVYRVEHVHLPV